MKEDSTQQNRQSAEYIQIKSSQVKCNPSVNGRWHDEHRRLSDASPDAVLICQPIQSSLFFSQGRRGLPFLPSPWVAPIVMSFSTVSPSVLSMWPQYVSLCFLKLGSSSRSLPICSKTDLLDFFWVMTLWVSCGNLPALNTQSFAVNPSCKAPRTISRYWPDKCF